jgi:hypothetical protein
MDGRNRKHPERWSVKFRRVCIRDSMRIEHAKDVCKDRVKWRSILSANPARDMA